MIIGFDLDGPCYEFARSVERYINFVGLPYTPKFPTDRWAFFEDWGMTKDEFVQVCNDGVDAGIIFGGPIKPGVIGALCRVHDMGHSAAIITSRFFGSDPKNSKQNTIQWLDDHGAVYDHLIFSSDKTVVKTDFFIEDNVDNYDALDAAGTEVYLVNCDWNLQPDNRRRVNSVSEFVDIVEAKTNLRVPVN